MPPKKKRRLEPVLTLDFIQKGYNVFSEAKLLSDARAFHNLQKTA